VESVQSLLLDARAASEVVAAARVK
jgi:hypothetical protein